MCLVHRDTGLDHHGEVFEDLLVISGRHGNAVYLVSSLMLVCSSCPVEFPSSGVLIIPLFADNLEDVFLGWEFRGQFD